MAWGRRTATCRATSSSARASRRRGRRSGASSFLPAAYQGTLDFRPRPADRRTSTTPTFDRPRRRGQLDALARLNGLHRAGAARTTAGSTRGSARSSWRSGCSSGPRRRSTSPRSRGRRKALYGLDDPITATFGDPVPHGPAAGRARGPVRPGLSHPDIQTEKLPALGPARGPPRPSSEEQLRRHRRRPSPASWPTSRAEGSWKTPWSSGAASSAGLPTAEGKDGREHHPFGFTMWLAGGGVKGGIVHGNDRRIRLERRARTRSTSTTSTPRSST